MSPPPPAPISGIPGPRGLPVVGSLPRFARDSLGFMHQVRADHGPVAQYTLSGYRILQVTDAELIEEILLKKASSMHKDAAYDSFRPLLGNGLVTAENPAWRRNRKLAAPSFSPKRIAVYADTMVRCTQDYIAEVGAGGTRELQRDMMGLTQNIVLRTLFGDDIQADTQVVGDAMEVVMQELASEIHKGRSILPGFVRTPGRRRSARAIRTLDAQVHHLIEARRAAGLGDDLLSRLLAARDEDGAGFDDQQVRDEAITLFLAGHETTALALTYTLLLLGDHPEVADRLRDEVDTVLQGRRATAEDLKRLPWTRATILESLRLMPPVWVVGRQTIEEVQIGQYALPPGIQIVIPIHVLHRELRYFPRPERFEPERWLDDLERRLPRMAWIPFGGGPRICIGNHFAMMEATLVLATLTQSLRFRPHGAFPPRLLTSITLRPRDAVPATILPRGPARDAAPSAAQPASLESADG